MIGTRLSFAVVGVVVAATAAQAQPAARPVGSYFFTGDVEGKFDAGSLHVSAAENGTFAVQATEERAKKNRVEWSGAARLDGRTFTIVRAPASSVGLTGALEGRATPDGSIEYVFNFDEKLERGFARVYRVASGARTEIGTARLKDERPFWDKLPGDLIGIAEKEIDKAVHKEIDLAKEFSIGDYAHVGARVSTQILRDGDRTALMKESDRLFREAGKGEPFWARSIVEGGARIAWGTTVPVDPSGAVTVSAGFAAGSQLRYTCDDQHRIPDGIRDYEGALATLEAVPARVFQLPISVDKTLALPLGTRRTFDGTGSLALSGGVQFGYKLEDMGVLEDRVDAGGSVGLSVWWNLHGTFKLEVERESGSLVRVRWTKSNLKGIGVAGSAALGFTVAPELLAKVNGLAEKPVEAVVSQGAKYARIEISASADWSNTKELVVDLLFDLSEPRARRAYEAAVIGNLLLAQDLAGAKDPGGLKASRITSTLTDALAFSANLRAFKILNASYASRSADVHVDVTTPLDNTTSSTESASYTKRTTGLFGGSRSLVAEATDREVLRADGPVERGTKFTFHYESLDKKGYWGEVDSQLELGVRLVGDPVAAQAAAVKAARAGDGGDYGKTTLSVDVALGSAAIDRILAVDDDAFFAAYATACFENDYRWTVERRNALRNVSLAGSRNDETYQEKLEREEAQALQGAKSMLKVLRKAAKTGTSRADRVQAFRKIARTDGFQMRAVIALALLAGENEVRVSFSLVGKGLNVTAARGQVTELPAH